MNDQEYMRRVRAMEPRLYRIAQAILWRDADCADAVQEAVFRGWMKKGGLNSPEYFETWLVRILINACKDQLRRRRREPDALEGDIAREDRLCERVALRVALRQLPRRYRLLLVLHHAAGYGIGEVADMLELSRGCVASRLHRARAMLRKLLDDGTENPEGRWAHEDGQAGSAAGEGVSEDAGRVRGGRGSGL